MHNIFHDHADAEVTDRGLVEDAQQGSRTALEALIGRYQRWIYNTALRMVGNPHDAEDITQEIVIKILTRLSSFQGKSRFRTWLFRIVKNHVLTMQQRPQEITFSSFEYHRSLIDLVPDLDLPDTSSVPVDVQVLVEEMQTCCMMRLLLCLDRQQRLIFILGEIFEVSSQVGAEILEISSENFRKQLSRARQHLQNFMDEKCGLMNPDNPCACARKTRAAIVAGFVDPHNLMFHRRHLEKIKSFVKQYADTSENIVESQLHKIFQEHPMLQSPDYVGMLDDILRREECQLILNFH